MCDYPHDTDEETETEKFKNCGVIKLVSHGVRLEPGNLASETLSSNVFFHEAYVCFIPRALSCFIMLSLLPLSTNDNLAG